MYLVGAPVHDPAAVLPFQLGARDTEMLFVPVLEVAATVIVPLVITVPAELYLVTALVKPEMPAQVPSEGVALQCGEIGHTGILSSWHCGERKRRG